MDIGKLLGVCCKIGTVFFGGGELPKFLLGAKMTIFGKILNKVSSWWLTVPHGKDCGKYKILALITVCLTIFALNLIGVDSTVMEKQWPK